MSDVHLHSYSEFDNTDNNELVVHHRHRHHRHQHHQQHHLSESKAPDYANGSVTISNGLYDLPSSSSNTKSVIPLIHSERNDSTSPDYPGNNRYGSSSGFEYHQASRLDSAHIAYDDTSRISRSNDSTTTTATRSMAKKGLVDSLGDRTYDFVPFDANGDSKAPHFDAEFFPEPLNEKGASSPWGDGARGPVLNDTFPLKTPFSNIPWGSSPQNNAAGGSYNISDAFYDQSLAISSFDPVQAYDIGASHLQVDNSTVFMDPSFNSTYTFPTTTTTGNSTATEDVYSWSILLISPLVVFGVAGNILVILAISLEKRLQNVTNYFLLSLAVTDLLVSLIVMPLSIINIFIGRWLFGLLLCDFFVTSDVLMCTSSILHLCTISLERFIGIRYPLWVKNKSKRVVLLKIVLVWTIALAITSPITVLGVVAEENILVAGECVLSNNHFRIYGSIFAFFIPLTIMILMYALTVRMLNKQAKLCHSRRGDDREGEPMIRRSTSRKNWQRQRPFYSGSTHTGQGLMENGDSSSPGQFLHRYRAFETRHNTLPMCNSGRRCGTGVGGANKADNLKRDTGGGSSHGGLGSASAGNNGFGSNGAGGTGNRSRSLHGSGTSVNNNKSNTDSLMINYSSKNHNSTRKSRGMASKNGGAGGGGGGGNDGYDVKSTSSNFSYCNGHSQELAVDASVEDQNSCVLSSSSSSSSPTSSVPTGEPKRLRELVKKHHVAVKAATILLMKRDNQHNPGQGHSHLMAQTTPPSSTRPSIRRDNSVRTEQKASKVLGVVFLIFVVCWAPFFISNIMSVLCYSCQFQPTLFTTFVWLGYVSSTLNPIIYTIFNNIFRNTFIKLLCCRYRLLHRARRNSALIQNGMLTINSFHPIHNTYNTTISSVEESNC